MVKRFLVFKGDTLRAFGGWRDFHDSYETRDEANLSAQLLLCGDKRWSWSQIVDLETGEMQFATALLRASE